MKASQFLVRLFRLVLPLTRREIHGWITRAEQIPDPDLRKQALASLEHKRFHADGGCVYAAARPEHAPCLVRLIVAFQTISDYLDNLCDRCDTYDMEDFRQLHHAMRDAINPDRPIMPYYALRGHCDDGGYLNALVEACRSEILRLPNYDVVFPTVEWLVERYCELQEYKHIDPSLRRETLEQWWNQFQNQFPDIHGWEFAAATGSTLCVFSLFQLAASDASPDAVRRIKHSYFPWVCGLHILLDYLIDLDEDQREGDFNFVACYHSPSDALQRVRLFARNGLDQAEALIDMGPIHKYVVHGLLGMYLSDEKVGQQAQVKSHRRLVWDFGPLAWTFYLAVKLYRRIR